MTGINFAEIFAFDVPLLEIFLRGTVMYLFLVLVMRFGMSRAMSNMGISDVLLIVLIADAAQNAMAGDHHTVGDGLILVSTILFWAYFIDYLCFRFPAMEAFLQPSRVCLVRNGRLLQRNMRRELITKAELMAQLRSNGVDDIAKVKEACLEANGELSVIKMDDKTD